jgi:hypothetical protein
MAKKLGEFLNEILTASGLAADNEVVANIVKATIATDLPEEIETAFHSKWATLESAKPKLREELRQEIVSGFAEKTGKDLKDFLKKEGWSDDELNGLSSKFLIENVQIALKKQLEKAQSKAKPDNQAIEDLKTKIASLEAQKLSDIESARNEEKAVADKLRGKIISQWESSEFNLPNLKLPDFSKSQIVKTAVNQYLDSLNGEFYYDLESGKVILHEKGKKDVPLYHKSKEVNWQDVKSLAVQNHLKDYLDTGNPGGNGNPNPANSNNFPLPDNGQKKASALVQNNLSALDKISSQLDT